MDQKEIWNDEAARRYDTPGEGMFAPNVLGPTVDRLATLAGDGAALEFAIGTGRVGIALRERGVPVTGIELSEAMLAQLRTKMDEAALPVVQGDMATATAPGVMRSSTSCSTRSRICRRRLVRSPASGTPHAIWSQAAGS